MDGQRETNTTPRQQGHGARTALVPVDTIMACTADAAQLSASEEDIDMHEVQDQWELVENDTPPYIRAQQAQARRDAALTAQANAAPTVHQEPFVFVGRNGPSDTVNNAGNRVRVYEHTTTQHIRFAPQTAPPRARAPDAPMRDSGRRPTPFPLVPQQSETATGTSDFDIARPPSPFPDLGAGRFDLSEMPSQQDIEFQQRSDDEYRQHRRPMVMPNMWDTEQDERLGQIAPLQVVGPQQRGPLQQLGTSRNHVIVAQQAPVMERRNRGICIRTRPVPRHPDGRFRHSPLPWPSSETDERHVSLDECRIILPRDFPPREWTPDVGEAHDQGRGINNPPRPTRPTWELEDDSDDEPRQAQAHARRMAHGSSDEDSSDGEYGDDEASMRQNRPGDDPQQPRGHRTLRVMNPDPDSDQDQAQAPVGANEEPARPSITRWANVNQAPLYSKLVFDDDQRSHQYVPTPGFHDWIQHVSTDRDEHDNLFHQWLHATDAESATKQAAEATVAPAKQDPGATDESSAPAQKEGAKTGKRAADGPSDERPSKRSRLASSFCRKLSLSGTAIGTTSGSGDISLSSARRRVSGLDIFNVRRFSSMPSGLSRSSSFGLKRVRIAVVGDSSAGKTTLLNLLYTGAYQPAERSPYYRNNDFSITVDGQPGILEAWDIPGELPVDESHPLNRSFFDSALICFAVDNVQNVDSAPHWVRVLQSCLVVDIPLYLVGLKCDARPSFPKLRLPFMNEATLSSLEQCEDAARSIGAVEYFECSAKTGNGVDEMFHTVIRHARSKKDEEELKRASRLRKERLRRGFQDTGRRISNLFRGGSGKRA